jgi:hypothetical protein
MASALPAYCGASVKLRVGVFIPFVDPSQTSCEAHPIWSPEAGAAVLTATAGSVPPSTSPADVLSVLEVAGAVHLLIDDRKRNHLLLVCGNLALQLLIEGADLLSGPVYLNFIVPGIAGIDSAIEKLAALRQILTRPSELLCTPQHWSAQTLRLRNALIALDGHAARASYRDVAAVIFGKDRVARDWPDPSIKDHVRRSLRRGRAYSSGGYRALIA